MKLSVKLKRHNRYFHSYSSKNVKWCYFLTKSVYEWPLENVNLGRYSATLIEMCNTIKSLRNVWQKQPHNFAVFSLKHLCWSLFWIKLYAFNTCNFTKRRLQHRCFPVNIAKCSRAPILKNICERLLLIWVKLIKVLRYIMNSK